MMIQSSCKPSTTVDTTMKRCAAVVRGTTIPPMTLILRSREVRADPVGSLCPKMTLVRNAASVW